MSFIITFCPIPAGAENNETNETSSSVDSSGGIVTLFSDSDTDNVICTPSIDDNTAQISLTLTSITSEDREDITACYALYSGEKMIGLAVKNLP